MLAPRFWRGGDPGARLLRAVLWPPAAIYRAAVATRQEAYQIGVLRARHPGLPTVAVGGLTVGGAGKTPLASWIAAYFARRGLRPGVVLRGVGGDETVLHRRLVPTAVVIEDANRIRGSQRAAAKGAQILVLDDAFQRLDVARDLNVAVVATEQMNALGLLPQGPWREPLRALQRADLVVVSRKTAPSDLAAQTAQRLREHFPAGPIALASLQLSRFQRMIGRQRATQSMLRGASVLAAAGIANPEVFGEQCRSWGATVTVWPWPDHHPYTAQDAKRLAWAAAGFDYLVVTPKDAVKLKWVWPPGAPDPLVGHLSLKWEEGYVAVRDLLSRLCALSCGPGHETGVRSSTPQ